MKLLPINKNNDVEMLLIVPEIMENNVSGIVVNYLNPLGDMATKILVASVFVPKKGVLKKAIFLEEWEQIKEVLDTYSIKKIAVANPDYFNKILQAKKKLPFERLIGELKEIDDVKVTPVLNFLALTITPMKKHLLQKSVDTMRLIIENKFTNSREDFLKSLKIDLLTDSKIVYQKLKEYFDEPVLAIDIEATGLLWHSDKLLTISFSKSEMEGFSIALHEKYSKDWKKNLEVIKKFFEKYRGTVIFHNAQFDIPFLVYTLWMDDVTDTKNMIKGVNYFKTIDDTMVMSYLCLNSIDRPKLGLKDLAFVKYGDWDNSIEVSQLVHYPFKEVGKYNTIDTMATFYIYQEYSKRLVEEEQDKLYYDFYRPFIKAIIKMKMNGITIDIDKIKELDKTLSNIYKENLEYLNTTKEVMETIYLLKKKAKKQSKRESEINKIVFNPKSSTHLRVLLFDVLGFKPIKFSKNTGEPSTDKETIRDLFKLTKEETVEYKILFSLKEISEMKTVHSTFIKGFENKTIVDKKENYKLFPNFNIVGTLSGRMAGRDPSLLNIPSGSRFGKAIKKTIIAQKGYIVAQVDSGQLEDRVIATASQDKNKMNIFLKGLDGHAIGTAAYFKDELKEKGIEINLDDIDSVNSIKDLAPDLRSASKPITFALAYGGTEHTLMENIGFSEQKAKNIVKAYKELYKGIEQYKEKVEEFCLNNGYVVGMFGLKARGDLEHIYKESEYQKSFRSLYNMTIQSSALIISRAIFKLQEWIEKNNLEESVKITNSVYDSIYIEIVPDVQIITKVNKAIVEFMCPSYINLMYDYRNDIKNKTEISLTAELELGNSWIAEVELSNNITKEEVQEQLNKLVEKEQ